MFSEGGKYQVIIKGRVVRKIRLSGRGDSGWQRKCIVNSGLQFKNAQLVFNILIMYFVIGAEIKVLYVNRKKQDR